MNTGISNSPSGKHSIALLMCTTILWISQVTYNVTAEELTTVQDTVPGAPESHKQIASSDLDRRENHIENTTSGTGDSPGYYQKYKQFVAKHNKTFTIVFGVLFVISLVVAIAVIANEGNGNAPYVTIPILLGIGIFGFVLYRLYGQKLLAFFRNKKAPVVKDTVDVVDSST